MVLAAALAAPAPSFAQDNQILDDAAMLAEMPPAFVSDAAPEPAAPSAASVQTDEILDDAAALAETPPAFASDLAAAEPGTPEAVVADSSINLLIAAHKTDARRYSDTYLINGNKRRRPVAVSMRLRRADDANFTNRTRYLARRVAEMGRPISAPQLAVAATGEEFLDALVAASRNGPIGNLVVYGHAAPDALFMREDRGFYASVMEVAKISKVVSGEEDVEKDEQLRLVGARDLTDFEWLLKRGDIKFTRNAVIVFAGCGVAGKRDVDPHGIAARMAEMTGGTVIASLDVTDQSMGRGAHFRNNEYSRRTWVRFVGNQTPERLNTRVIDALKQMNFDGAAVATGPQAESLVSANAF